MAAPKKPKSAGVQKGKTKVAAATAATVDTKTSNVTLTSPGAVAVSSASNGNSGSAPTAEMIRARAFEIFMARDGRSGDELSDWLAAEREIMKSRSAHS